jgi:uncharacterized membrane protein
MANFSGTTTVYLDSSAVFSYLSDFSNLPDYFSRLTSAVPSGGDRITTTAEMPDGSEVQGDAWFRVDQGAQRIEWGSEGSSDYHGYLDVTPTGDAAQVEVYVHTTRVDDGDETAEDSVTETLATIKRLLEEEGAADER